MARPMKLEGSKRILSTPNNAKKPALIEGSKIKAYFQDLAACIPGNALSTANLSVGINEMMAQFFFNGMVINLSIMDMEGGAL